MLISPPALVPSCAVCRVRHGAGRVQGLVSTPLAEMNERVLSACAGAAPRPSASRAARMVGDGATFGMDCSLELRSSRCRYLVEMPVGGASLAVLPSMLLLP